MEREQTTIRMPLELKQILDQEAVKRGIGFNPLVLMILNEARIHHQKE